jgi:hypothetical protein
MGNLGHPDDAAGAIPDQRDGQRNVNQAAVFVATDRFVMLHPLALLDPREDLRLFMTSGSLVPFTIIHECSINTAILMNETHVIRKTMTT